MKRADALGPLAALAASLGLPLTALADDPAAAPGSEDAAAIVSREVAAYNAHDAATVVKMHAPDATFTLLPAGHVLAQGSEALLAFFNKNFSDHPNAKITLEKQIVLKSVVINNYTTAAGTRIVSIYQVANGVIANEWLILG